MVSRLRVFTIIVGDTTVGFKAWFELPWSNVDPFNDGFKAFNLYADSEATTSGSWAVGLCVNFSDGTYSENWSTDRTLGGSASVQLRLDTRVPVKLYWRY